MKLLLILTILSLTACNCSNSTDKLLAEVWHKDQYIRHQMLEVTKAVSIDGKTELIDSLITLSENVDRIDKENIAVIDSLLQQGLPKGLSDESYKTIWIVIDHASLAKQEQYLPLVEQMAAEGCICRSEYAVLYDRVAMGQNRPQRYGSQLVQFGTTDAQKLYVWPIEDPETLDLLRNSVGMSLFSEYLNHIEETTGITPIFDSNITTEELNKMRGVDK